MNILSCIQVLFLLVAVFILVDSSPISNPPPLNETDGPIFKIENKPDIPVADQIEEDTDIKTRVIGKMDDLEATTWISSLSELQFTFPPSLVKSLEDEEDYV